MKTTAMFSSKGMCVNGLILTLDENNRTVQIESILAKRILLQL